MTPIDEDGRLFGRVNVYDALVVLVVLGAVAAGVVYAVPFGGEDGEPATRYATVDLGERSPAVAERISEGDVATGDDGTNLTVTDTYVGPADGRNVSVVARVRVDGRLVDRDGSGETFEFAGVPVRRGEAIDVATSRYDVRGEVLALDAEGETLDTGTLPVLVRADLSRSTADLVSPGDEYRIDGRAVATVERSVVTPRMNRTNGTDAVGLTLRTVRYGGDTYFGDRRVLLDRTIEFRTDRYAFSGVVTRWGNASVPGRPVERTVVVKATNVGPEIADGIEAGMVDRRDNVTVARVTDVRTEPASVVLTSDDGNIYEREHPRNEDVYLTVELRARATGDGLRFRTRPLREGTTIGLDLGTVSVSGEVVAIQQ
ncbi:DUF4330 domain-containing protein [Halostella salina]|uniref:DUF4330 domain-containing protein n=1 Tax=Halostella salina TaxID=1547897 RepID=UPI0013CF04D8|nr:DUF4330 domain-containing protein [Halostella salina]